MDYKKYFKNYFKSLNNILDKVDTELINDSVKLINEKKDTNKTIFLAGNGGSASIANHVSVDFVKAAKIKSLTFNNSNLITCFANDFNHENWIKEAIKSYSNKDDLIILISSSGKSQNILNAAKYCHDNNIDLITLSGFSRENELHKLGKINFHVQSEHYNFIEMTHHIILLSIVDILAENIFE